MSRAYYASLLRLSNSEARSVACQSRCLGICVCLLLLLDVVPGVMSLLARSGREVKILTAGTPGDRLPEGWEALTFTKIARQTVYRLLADGSTAVLQARSTAAASGVRREMMIDPRLYPIIQWRWKVTEAPRTSDVRQKESDDAPARLYVAFAYDEAKVSWLDRAEFALLRSLYGQDPPLATVMYVWERQLTVGTLVTSPYTKRVKTFVLRNSADAQGIWYSEERNVYEDYRRAFGGEPPFIAGIGLMTDTDNTGETATAYYGDILLRPSAH